MLAPEAMRFHLWRKTIFNSAIFALLVAVWSILLSADATAFNQTDEGITRPIAQRFSLSDDASHWWISKIEFNHPDRDAEVFDNDSNETDAEAPRHHSFSFSCHFSLKIPSFFQRRAQFNRGDRDRGPPVSLS